MSRTFVLFKWHKRFKKERKEENDPRIGRPSKRSNENIELVKQQVCGDRLMPVRIIAN